MKEQEEKCCGNCCWFYGEQTEGDGMCIVHQFDGDDLPWYCCTMSACREYVSRQEMRHHMAVLLQHNRWRRSGFPDNCHQVDPFDVGDAIDFSVKYMKIFSKL